jgi:CheY-like chemotaxis protein
MGSVPLLPAQSPMPPPDKGCLGWRGEPLAWAAVQILLIEDEDSIRSALVRALERDGHVVRAAASLAEARGLLEAGRPDLAVSDLKLPDGDGLELVGQLGVPFIMISGYATYDDAVRALRTGAVDFFTKPVAIKDVRAAILRAGNGRRLDQGSAWSDPDGALAAVRALIIRLPGRLARLAACELVQAAPVGRISVQADDQGVRIWLDGLVDWTVMGRRRAWLEAHGITLLTSSTATVATVAAEKPETYDDQAELLWDEELVLGRTVQALRWRIAGSWLIRAVESGAGPFAGLEAAFVHRLEACGVSVRTVPATLAEAGVGGAERAGLLADPDLGAPVA